MLVQCYWLTLFCSVKTYNCSTSPLVHLLSFFSSQWTSLWWHTHQRGILNTPPPQFVFSSQCAPCFSLLAATVQDVVGRAACASDARCLCASASSFSLWKPASKRRKEPKGKMNLWPQLSPVQQQTLNAVFAHHTFSQRLRMTLLLDVKVPIFVRIIWSHDTVDINFLQQAGKLSSYSEIKMIRSACYKVIV